MLKALLDRFAIRPFERAFGYDAGYMRDVLAASPASFLKFSVLRASCRAATRRPRRWPPPASSPPCARTAAPAPRSASTSR